MGGDQGGGRGRGWWGLGVVGVKGQRSSLP